MELTAVEKVYGKSRAPELIGKRVCWNDYSTGEARRVSGNVTGIDPTNIYACTVTTDAGRPIIVAALRLDVL